MNSHLETKIPTDDSVLTKESSLPQMSENEDFASFVGSIPAPHFLDHYERLVPGCAKKFLEEPLVEAEHQRALEKFAIEQQVKISKIGQWLAFIFVSLCTTAAFASVFLGYDNVGLVALFLSLCAFVAVFLYGKNQNRDF